MLHAFDFISSAQALHSLILYTLHSLILYALEFISSAQALLGYYDHLYDAHLSNASGNGSGTGARVGAVVDVSLPSAAFDAELLATLVLRRVAVQPAKSVSTDTSTCAGTDCHGYW